MSELRQDKFFHRYSNPSFRAGKRDKDLPPTRTGTRAAHEGRRADVLIAQIAKDFTEAVKPLIEELHDDLISTVARSDTGTAIDDNRLNLSVRERFMQKCFYISRVVLDDSITDHLVLFVGQQRLDQLPALVGGLVSGVTDGHDKAMNASFALCFVLFYRHRRPYRSSGEKYNSRLG